jgi:hypothetical protein
MVVTTITADTTKNTAVTVEVLTKSIS